MIRLSKNFFGSTYGRIGKQVWVPITGNRAKRIVHGVINIHSGEVVLLITQEWVQETHQYFLSMIRSHWRGWNIVLFEDRGSPHTAEASLELAFSGSVSTLLHKSFQVPANS
jgi:hypothetical protein